jgi:hypothetical protein
MEMERRSDRRETVNDDKSDWRGSETGDDGRDEDMNEGHERMTVTDERKKASDGS